MSKLQQTKHRALSGYLQKQSTCCSEFCLFSFPKHFHRKTINVCYMATWPPFLKDSKGWSLWIYEPNLKPIRFGALSPMVVVHALGLGVSQNVFHSRKGDFWRGEFQTNSLKAMSDQEIKQVLNGIFICLELQNNQFFVRLFEIWMMIPNHCYKKGLFHHFHPLKSGCLGYQVFFLYFSYLNCKVNPQKCKRLDFWLSEKKSGLQLSRLVLTSTFPNLFSVHQIQLPLSLSRFQGVSQLLTLPPIIIIIMVRSGKCLYLQNMIVSFQW